MCTVYSEDGSDTKLHYLYRKCKLQRCANCKGVQTANCAFPQNFHTRKSGEITVFFSVLVSSSGNCIALGLMQWKILFPEGRINFKRFLNFESIELFYSILSQSEERKSFRTLNAEQLMLKTLSTEHFTKRLIHQMHLKILTLKILQGSEKIFARNL